MQQQQQTQEWPLPFRPPRLELGSSDPFRNVVYEWSWASMNKCAMQPPPSRPYNHPVSTNSKAVNPPARRVVTLQIPNILLQCPEALLQTTIVIDEALIIRESDLDPIVGSWDENPMTQVVAAIATKIQRALLQPVDGASGMVFNQHKLKQLQADLCHVWKISRTLMWRKSLVVAVRRRLRSLDTRGTRIELKKAIGFAKSKIVNSRQ
ncbi:hypothetical protein H1R20_g14820, partial [Candolleomyces eurysporus]